ncbi:MAG: hypothetical protein ABIG69_17625 [Bacteroidota bacterium]
MRKNTNSFQVIELKRDGETPPIKIFNREIRYLKAKDVRRAMSKLISEYCKGSIASEEAKTLTHMFSTYIQILSATSFEERLETLEGESHAKQ